MLDYLNSDEYIEYIKRNCGVRGYDFGESDIHCARPDVDVILYYINKMDIHSQDKVLEVGCGFGRILYEIHKKYQLKPYGIDLLPEMIRGAKERVAKLCAELKISAAEKIGYPDKEFDKIICWGVFDLTEQEKSLFEMSRTLSVSGRLLVSGKNDQYLLEDNEAYLAEVASIKKGIPNHYTNITRLLMLAQKLGLKCINAWYFKKRGDLSLNKPDSELSEILKDWNFNKEGVIFDKPFYEYVFLFEKRDFEQSLIGFKGAIGSKRSISGLALDKKYRNG